MRYIWEVIIILADTVPAWHAYNGIKNGFIELVHLINVTCLYPVIDKILFKQYL